jgi:hemerythrin-like domain-containing protein
MASKRGATRRPARRKAGNSAALEMLMQDHKRVQKLFRDFEKADREDTESCRKIVQLAIAELKVHTRLEEQTLYPEARHALEDSEHEALIDEAEVEHDAAKQLIAKLEGLEPDDPHYAATFTVLGEYVKHHIEEEEQELFPRLRKAKLDMGMLGQHIRERKEVLQRETGTSSTRMERESRARGGTRH